ncbi:MAG: MFS transporter [Acidimicrobiales bacterium]|nr:MAG: MFS transporter [Acidimicrobiales bacterium]
MRADRRVGPPDVPESSGHLYSAPPHERHVNTPPLFVIFSVTVTGVLANTLVNAPLPDILRHFSRSGPSAGLFVASGTIAGVVMAPAIGLLADRVGRRTVLLPCLLAFGVFGVLGGLAPSFEILLIARTLQGLGAAGLLNLAVVLIGDHWAGTERTRVIGWNAAVLTISLVIFPSMGGLLTELWGWRAAFAPYAIGFFAAWMVVRWLPDGGPRGASPTLASQLKDAAALLRRPELAGSVAFGFVSFVLIFGLFLTVLPILLEQRFSLGPAARGLAISAPAASSTISALTVGRLARRWGRVRLLVLGCSMWAVAFVAIGAAGALPVLLAGALLYGFGEGMVIPAVQDLVTSSAPDRSRGVVVASFVAAVRAGQTVGPLGMATASEWLGTGGVFFFGAAVAGAMAFAASVSEYRREHRNSRAPE